MKKERLKSNLKKQRGITLIALVVTIIVLIILAVISVNLVFNENGIIGKAQKAGEFQANAEASDNERLGQLDSEINHYIPVNLEELLPKTGAGSKVAKPEKWTSEKVIPIDDGTGTAVPLPDGFYYVGGDKTNGLVISDNPSDANKGTSYETASTLVGNQFVWIPVSGEADLERTDFDTTTGQPTNSIDAKYSEPFTSGGTILTGYPTEEAEYNRMKTQVLQYNGFYIGRYEAGVNSTELRTEETTAQTVVCKKGVAPYNYVPWGKSMSDIGAVEKEVNGETIQVAGAAYLSQNMYKTSGSVSSTLCYGCEWDAMCRYIGDSQRPAPAESEKKLTGNEITDMSKNIYDLAGNCWEWSMEGAPGLESRSPYTRVFRGHPTALRVRGHAGTVYTAENITFRCALYIK